MPQAEVLEPNYPIIFKKQIMKFNINNTYFGILILLFLSSCSKNFEEINSNENSPIDVQPSLLLRHVIYNYGEEMSYEGFVAGNLLSQHFTQIDFNLFDRHSLTETQFGGNPWPIFYNNLRDNQIILDKAQSNPIFKVYEGPALVLKAYMAAALTDIYGDVPYSEALGGLKGNVKPSYDLQENIYNSSDGIIDNLNQAILSMESYSGAQSLEGDILYGGDLNLWIKFANSLKIKYLIRISDRENVSTELAAIFNSGMYLSNNLENATFDFSDGQPNNFRMATLRDGDFNLFILSETAEEILKTNRDPRLEIFYRPFGNDISNSKYSGLLNGPDASATSISVSDYSLTGSIFREHTGDLDANFMTAWETEFLLAEAAEKGLISSSAQMHYENGVQMAFEYWGAVLPPTYLTTDSAAYGSFNQNKIEQIISQKWIANIINGYESWIEYRRTGFPQLKVIDASLNNDEIPSRMPYPTDEDALNNENYIKATSTNGNSINAKVWWDIN